MKCFTSKKNGLNDIITLQNKKILWNSYRVQLLPGGEAQTRAEGDLRGLLQLHGRAAFTSGSPSTPAPTSPNASH